MPRPSQKAAAAKGRNSLEAVRARAAKCRACDLWERGTQTVFGEGPIGASLMLVGEQPGDQEDKQGKPFVGPAGRVLAEAMERVGLDPAGTYLTNAVKHFKWVPRGKRRIHDKPNRPEIAACKPWLDLEIEHVKPKAIVALGATAASALLGNTVRVMRDRGRLIESSLAPIVSVTVHPSSILRAPDADARRAAMDQFVEDLRALAKHLRK